MGSNNINLLDGFMLAEVVMVNFSSKRRIRISNGLVGLFVLIIPVFAFSSGGQSVCLTDPYTSNSSEPQCNDWSRDWIAELEMILSMGNDFLEQYHRTVRYGDDSSQSSHDNMQSSVKRPTMNVFLVCASKKYGSFGLVAETMDQCVIPYGDDFVTVRNEGLPMMGSYYSEKALGQIHARYKQESAQSEGMKKWRDNNGLVTFTHASFGERLLCTRKECREIFQAESEKVDQDDLDEVDAHEVESVTWNTAFGNVVITVAVFYIGYNVLKYILK